MPLVFQFQGQAPQLQCYSISERAVLDEGSAQFSCPELEAGILSPGLFGEEGDGWLKQ